MQTPCNSLQIHKDSFYASDLYIESSQQLKTKPKAEELTFSRYFSDHMLVIEHSADLGGWLSPKIVPYAPLTIQPCSHVLHYGTACFEGMKAYYCKADDSVRLFRPEMNMARIKSSMLRICLPEFKEEELLKCIAKLVSIDKEWVPKEEGYSVYIRPFVYDDSPTLALTPPQVTKLVVIMCPATPYFPEGLKPQRVFLDESNVRAWPGGPGAYKLASNYAPTIYSQVLAQQKAQSQMALFCLPQGSDPEDAIISEFAGANVMVLIKKEGSSRPELITPPLDGTILPGVTRNSILQLCKEWDEFDVSERNITIKELKLAAETENLLEIFLCGTAVIVVPVYEIRRENGEIIQTVQGTNTEGSLTMRIHETLTKIQYGEVQHPWSFVVEDDVNLLF